MANARLIQGTRTMGCPYWPNLAPHWQWLWARGLCWITCSGHRDDESTTHCLWALLIMVHSESHLYIPPLALVAVFSGNKNIKSRLRQMLHMHESLKTAKATGLESALKDRNTAIIGNTLHFESKSFNIARPGIDIIS